jgi:hypothetical protein
MVGSIGNIPVQDNEKFTKLCFIHTLRQNDNGRSLKHINFEQVLDNIDIPLNIISYANWCARS